MTRGIGIERERSLSRQRRGSGECSTSVESTSRISHEMQFPAASAMRRGANENTMQYDPEDFSVEDTPDDFAAEKPELEAYCDGSWWDVMILKRKREKYYVHYQKFTDQCDQWVPLIHLRIRCRTTYLSDCHKILPGIDVCVMTRHPHSDDRPPAWYDAKIIALDRRAHAPNACKCRFWIALYAIPDVLPSEFSRRVRLPVCTSTVTLKKMSIMREARNMSFQQVVDATLPGVTNSPRIWGKDGSRWYSSLDLGSISRDPSFSFESRVVGGSLGLSLSENHRGEHVSPEIRSFDAFLEEEGFEDPSSLSPDVKGEDVDVKHKDVDVKHKDVDVMHEDVDVKDEAGDLKDEDGDLKDDDGDLKDEDGDIPVVSGPQAQLVVRDADDVAICENDQMPDDGIKHLDRYSSDESEEWTISPKKVEVVWVNPNPTSKSEDLGNPDEALDEVVVSDLQSLKPTDRSPPKPISVTPELTSLSPSVQTIPSVPLTARPIELDTSSGDSDLDFAEHLEQSIDVLAIAPTDEPATLSQNSDGDEFAAYLERSIAKDYFAKPLVTENHAAKRSIPEMHDAKRRPAKNLGRKRRRLEPFSFPEIFWKGSLKTKPPPRRRIEQPHLKKAVKEKTIIYPCEVLKTTRAPPVGYPVKVGKTHGRVPTTKLEEYAGELEELLLDERSDMTLREKLAHSKETSKTGLLLQVKRSKKVVKEVAAVPKFVEKEITYAELFESVEPVQPDVPSEDKGFAEESGLLPSWNPLMESVVPALPQDDPLADIWEVMRVAQEIEKEVSNKVDEWEKELEVDCTDLVVKCEHPDGSQHPKHGALKFDQELGEVCEVCGVIVNDIKDMWARDNAKRIAVSKEGNCGSDADNDGCDQDVLAFWDAVDENHVQQKDIEGGSNFDLIPDLVTEMKEHQKQGFQFLWRNLDGQGSNGNSRFEKGGCVLSHAPGTGKTFLIISFLYSYMKKYPNTRPIILAPKIMLQPWAKEFLRWNVNIPVYNFNQAGEQGRLLHQKHVDAGIVRLNHSGKPGKKLLVCREAMLLEWIRTQSVLTISYPMFNNLYKTSPSDTRMFTIRKLLLESPTIMILDEGHIVRNKKAQVLKQLNAVKTPLRVMLSGTLFQNNFEELYTCLNAVRPGFVKTFAKAAGLKFNIQQELESQSDVESEQLATERKGKAHKLTESQARRLFIEEIGNKIDKGQKTKSSSESLTEGLAQLRRLTSIFIHHYTGSVLKKNLLPLRDFAIMFQPTDLQERMIQKLSMRMGDKTMLERECLLSLVCIHPTLFSQHNVGKSHTDLLPPEEMMQVASNRDPAVGVKTRFVINLLKQLRLGQEKILIFCQNLDPLLLLEEMLGKQFDWVREREILQIDGKVQPDERQSIIERFNDKNNRVRVLLASTKACGEGVTLTGASRVVFMDVLWNPAVIRQAIHRAFRIGQEKVVHVYRLVFSGTFEEGKYRRMVWKDHKSQAIFFENQQVEEKSSSAQPGFWEIQKQCSKDPVLNELCRQDSELDHPAFKHVFRHGGLFDDDYEADPEGKGTDAIDWLRGIEGVESFDLETDDTSGDDGDTEDFDGLDDDV